MPEGLPGTPWIHGPEVAQHYQQGAALGMAQQRMQLQAQETQAQLEMQKQQIEIAKSYHQQQMALGQQRLQQAQQLNQMKMLQAASKYAANERIRQRIAAGEDEGRVIMEEGLAGGMTGPGLAAMYKARQATMVPPPSAQWHPPGGGAPGYFTDPRGVPHFPPSSRMDDRKKFEAGLLSAEIKKAQEAKSLAEVGGKKSAIEAANKTLAELQQKWNELWQDTEGSDAGEVMRDPVTGKLTLRSAGRVTFDQPRPTPTAPPAGLSIGGQAIGQAPPAWVPQGVTIGGLPMGVPPPPVKPSDDKLGLSNMNFGF